MGSGSGEEGTEARGGLRIAGEKMSRTCRVSFKMASVWREIDGMMLVACIFSSFFYGFLPLMMIEESENCLACV